MENFISFARISVMMYLETFRSAWNRRFYRGELHYASMSEVVDIFGAYKWRYSIAIASCQNPVFRKNCGLNSIYLRNSLRILVFPMKSQAQRKECMLCVFNGLVFFDILIFFLNLRSQVV